jgi:hypothetical protein
MFIGSDDYSPRQNFYQIEKTRQALPSSGLTEGTIALIIMIHFFLVRLDNTHGGMPGRGLYHNNNELTINHKL